MADEKPLLGDGLRSALSDGAARFDTVARDVKSRQFAQTRGSAAAELPGLAVSPDEAWARSFASQGIGPQPEMMRITGFQPPPMPSVSLEFARSAPALAAAEPTVVPAGIGGRLGKAEPRRSLLARLFRPAR